MVLLKNVTEVVHSRGYTRIRILAGSLLPYCFPEINRIYATIKYIQYHMSEPIVAHRKGGLVILMLQCLRHFSSTPFFAYSYHIRERAKRYVSPGPKVTGIAFCTALSCGEGVVTYWWKHPDKP